jgi:hypothetical protein
LKGNNPITQPAVQQDTYVRLQSNTKTVYLIEFPQLLLLLLLLLNSKDLEKIENTLKE